MGSSSKDLDTSSKKGNKPPLDRLRITLRFLYHGRSPAALRFQFAVLLIDLAIISLFIADPILRDKRYFILVDLAVAGLLTADLVARALASYDFRRWLRQPVVWVDLFVLATLLLPHWLDNFGFLRILRLWTLSQSGFLWRPFRRHGFKPWEETARAVVNLLTFLFVVTGYVYAIFARQGDSGITGYVDALYFTVTSVTTTGYGDITLPGTLGKLSSIVIMIVGISLFVRLAQAIFRPNKVFYPCPQCGLQRHEPDAVHCKACGHVLNIPDEGS